MNAIHKYQEVQRYAEKPSARREVRGNVVEWRAEAVQRREDRAEALVKLARRADHAVQRDVGAYAWASVSIFALVSLSAVALAISTWMFGLTLDAICREIFL